MLLCAAVLASLLVIGGVEQNPGRGVEESSIMQVLCSGCDRNLKSGIQCDTCGRWFHDSCGNVKAQVAESGWWICERCRSEILRLLEEKLQNALLQIEDLTRRNKALEDQLRLASAGREVVRRDTASGHQEDGKCLVLGDSVIRNVGTDNSDIMVECFLGIRTEQLHRVIDNIELGSPDAIVLHVGTNDLRKTRNLYYVMGEVYGLENTAKTKFPTPRIGLSGVLRRTDVSWRRIGAINK
jgi:hypothetical protein